MPGFVHGHLLWAVAALAVLLASPPAGAIPPSAYPGQAGAAALAQAPEQPLPTLVPPANDAFGAAEAVAGLPFTASVSTLEATTAPDDPSCAGNAASVWYAYASPVTVWLTADTFGSDYNTTLSAYTGSPGSLDQVACNDDTGAGAQSEVTFLASAGVTYYLMAAGIPGGGALELALDIRSPLHQIGVRTTAAYEGYPAAGPDHLAWAQWPRRNGHFWTAYVQEAGGPRAAVNRRRTSGFPGGVDGETFVFQETRRRTSDLVFYDLASGTRSAPPAGVNTRAWEWNATISGDWLLYGRQLLGQRRDLVLLRNLASGQSILLDQISWRRNQGSVPGQVSGNYAVWHRCAPWCNVYLYDIAAGTTTRVTNRPRRHHYYPAVTDDGTIYYMRSGPGCGASVQLVRRDPGGSTAVLAALRRRWDSAQMQAVENADGTTAVFYDRVHCRTSAWDVLEVVDP
jgi:hypothetical protein